MGVEVSVIVPVYNARRWLGECLRSVLSQSLREIEVICVDDGSDDGSADTVREFAAADPRVRLECVAHVPTGEVRNRALELATGRYVAFMDADDRYPRETTLETLWTAAERTGLPIVGGYLLAFRDRPPESLVASAAEKVHYPSRAGEWRYADFQGMYGFYCYLYRRDLIEASRVRFPAVSSFEDPLFLVRAMLAAGRFYATDECVYLYRVDHKAVDFSANGYAERRERTRGIGELMRFAVERNMELLFRRLLFEAVGWIRHVADFEGVWDELRGVMETEGRSGWLTLKDRLLLCHWSVPLEPLAKRIPVALRLLHASRPRKKVRRK